MLRTNAESIAEYLELDPTERPITTLPMNYTYGLSIMNSHFQVGAAVLLTEHTLFERESGIFSGSREQLPLAASLTPIRS